MRNFTALSLSIVFGILGSARADLTIIQKVEGAGQDVNVTVKIKGDKERVEAAGQPTRIINGKTGEITNLLDDRKAFATVSAAQIKTAADSMDLGADKKSASTRLNATGKKETIGGYETEEYAYETPRFKASFWIASKYPGVADILKQMQAPITGALKPSNMGMPDYTDFNGLPLKTVISVGSTQIVTTIVSIKQDPLSASEFEIPKDFEELKSQDQSESQSDASPGASATP
jgi:Domain of unknown function (DUF4412)